ncbi:Pr6Pr family membrane protein [Microbacterium betulae]|uniref:Pr6Pr family membrane protein n=1 Tax=Microbacterium betulae TaxID=2981139 RepID=A0AA97I7W8_9MICO|nr:Pr6Pr family membrane protein [Microbacterium sp. AB]WOF24077.1 Pr6Pr family membrane protein [Microbacterium sp. AB]
MTERSAASLRIAVGATVIAVVGYAYGLRVAVGDANPFDYFGYFTNLTCLLACVVLIVTGALALGQERIPDGVVLFRAVATACLLVVGVVYNVLVPGTGSAPSWVSVVLHVVFPVLALVDWALLGDRPPLAWRKLWLVLPYPATWIVVVLIRGVTDGWVPYGFLLPERGTASLIVHVILLFIALMAAGALVWTLSRRPGAALRRSI